MVSPQPPRTVSGQVFQSDGQPLRGTGFTARAFDAVSAANLVPLGSAVALQANGTYRIPYTWQSTGGRNGPNLLVQVFNPQGMMVGQAGRQFAAAQETLNITVNIPAPPPPTFTLFCVTLDPGTNAPIPNLRIEASFRAGEQALFTQSGTTGDRGELSLVVERSRFNPLPTGQPIAVTFRVFDGSTALQTSTALANLQLEDQKINIAVVRPVVEERYTVRGTVSQSNGQPLAGAIVHVDDWDRNGEDHLFTTRTNANGYYEGQFTAEQFRRSSGEVGGPDLIVRVYNEQGQLLVRSPRRNNSQPEETIDLTVTVLNPAPQADAFVVKGQVHQANGLPLAGVIVRAFDRDLRSEQPLGQQTSDPTGYYEIAYTREQFQRAEKDSADLVLRLFTAEGEEVSSVDLTTEEGTPLARLELSDAAGNSRAIAIWFNAPPIAVINATLTDTHHQGLSEDERYRQALAPLLENVPLTALTPGDIAFLAAETQIDAQHITYLHLAAQRQHQTQVAASAYYGLFRQNLPTDLARLLVGDVSDWQRALHQSLAENLIPRSLTPQVEAILAQLQALLPRYLGGAIADDQTVPLVELLTFTLPDAALRQQFVTAYGAYDGQDTDAFWVELRTQPGFHGDAGETGAVEALRFAFEASTLTLHHLPLVQALQQEQQQGRWQTAQDLVQLEESDWRTVLNRSIEGQPVGVPAWVPGATSEAQQQTYIQILMRVSEAAFPTQAIAARLAQDSELPQGQDLGRFLRNNPDFDLQTTPLRRYVMERGESVLAGVQHPEAIVAAQRLAKVVPRYQLMRPLWADGLTSARAIVQLGESQFLARYAQPLGGGAQAQLIYRQAQAQSARALAVLSKYHTAFDLARPWVIGPTITEPQTPPEPALAPDLEILFGTLTTCQCEHCQSIYSPAAYLVDCLNLLREADLLGALRDRRPDIGAIELTCANSHTPLPYIDLVNELLERVIEGGLTATAYQTIQTAAELLAAPEHLTAAVYDTTLRDAVYPAELPFDLGLETARVYLHHLGTSRQELIELFQPEGLADLTGERLGLSAATVTIITTPLIDAAQVRSVYSADADYGLDRLGRVPELLYRANLTYPELLDLLGSTFVNSGSAVELREESAAGAGPTGDPPVARCDLSRYVLTGITPGFFDRLHRFLRLCRGLGWAIADLDGALAALDAAELDLDGLRQLTALQHLQTRLATPLADLFPFWTEAVSDLRVATLLRLPLADLTILRQLLGDPILPRRPEATVAFLDRVEAIRQSRFQPLHLAYLYLNDADARAVLEPAPEQLQAIIRTLREGFATATAASERGALVIQTLADALSLDSPVLRALLETLLPEAIADFQVLALETPAPGETDPVPASLLTTFQQLHRLALLTSGFALSADEIRYFVASGGLTLDFDTLERWEHLYRYQALRDRLPRRRTPLIDVFTAPTEAAARARLLEATGWTEAETLSLSYPDHLRDAAHLSRRLQQIALSRRLNIELDALSAWATIAPSAAQAQAIRTAVRALYSETQWLAIARPLEDQLRERRRQALVAYLIHHPDRWLSSTQIARLGDLGREPDPTLLYEHLLIDVEISPCQLTSRIRQAIAAVQLFIQRCLMGLESGLEISPDQARQWETWRKTYRYWEANRKVFLYPENWIEPELRDDKTPFFHDLEQALLQNDVTADVVENAFLHYLNQLNDVAKLDIVGLYDQKEPGIDRLHVFGRTPGLPHRYYYRRRTDARYWTPWETVDLDIEGDHLIPVVWNRRLYLFWPIFTEKAEEQGRVSQSDTGSPPRKYWDIQLAYSEYRQGQWSAKILLQETLDGRQFGRSQTRLRPSTDFAFKGIVNLDSGDLLIYCYEFLSDTDSPTFVPVGFFQLEGCQAVAKVTPINPAGGVFAEIFGAIWGLDVDFFELIYSAPLGTKSQYMSFSETTDRRGTDRDALLLPIDNRASSSLQALGKTPGTFNLLPAHQFRQFLPQQQPFFFQDQHRVFFITREIPAPQVQATPPRPSVALPRLRESLLPSHWRPNLPGLGTGTQRVPDSAMASRGGRSPGTTAGDNPQMTLDLASGQWLTSSQVWLNRGFLGLFFDLQRRYIFRPFYHPYVCFLIKQLNRYGIEGVLNPEPEGEAAQLRRQQLRRASFFAADYAPNRAVVAPAHLDPIEDIDFTIAGAYSQYNWELFFHGPLLVADRLMQNQRFAEAQTWFHYIFDPTVGDDPTVDRTEHPDPARFWKLRPFFEVASDRRRPEDLLLAINRGDADLEDQVAQWENDPFNPHRIARLRITAYMKTVVMKYLDNLIAWGDHLFRQDTLETLGEATQIYVLAATILGQRPAIVPPRGRAAARTFDQLEPSLDRLGNALVALEEQLPAFGELPPPTAAGIPSVLYFCLPANDKLLSYWDVVSDRLFKLRHCMNIEGAVRQLPLFEPPIDPALLVRAQAAGVDLREVLTGTIARSPYRFTILVQKANELCAEVKSLGAALLSAYEKRDGEALGRLRSDHELRLLDAIKAVRQHQVEEAKETKAGLERAKELTEIRHDFYSSREFMNDWETASLSLTGISEGMRLVANILSLASGTAAAFPDFTAGGAGWAGSPVVLTHYGGSNVSAATGAASRAFEMLAATISTAASMVGVVGNYERRAEDWDLQARIAAKELAQIEKQIVAADIRLQITQKELENHDLQRQNARETDDYMRRKFTNQELYDWMVSGISAVYFQSYQLAYETARRAEAAYHFERATDISIIRFGQWDSLRRGLMAGERLQLDLRRLEMAYLNDHRREYEITKHISLVTLNPLALIALKATGQCRFELPETLFDLDYPGHFLRRIKTVSLSIPCVVGPYTSVNGKLTLESYKTRRDAAVGSGYSEATDPDDPRFDYTFVANQSIATSSAQNDSGLFELNFRDERYLPFEGAGAISDWQLDLSGKWRLDTGELVEFPQFDFDTITDVILHLRYTARDGGELLKQAAIRNLRTQLTSTAGEQGLFRLFSLRHEFPTEWHRFLQSGDDTFTVTLTQQHFPFMFQGSVINLNAAALYLAGQRNPVEQDLTPAPDDRWRFDLPGGPIRNALTPDNQGSVDAFLVCQYTVSLTSTPVPLAP